MTALYIHIPFCKKKCNYCDFVSYAGKEELIDEYVNALIREFETLTPFPPLPKGEGVKTIYFGGGTPTLLEPKHFEKILTAVCFSAFQLSAIEVSLESNPATADKTKLKALRQLGFNRLSIGCQSFNDKHLKVLGRIHTSKDILHFYDDARAAGFDNINLDLIFALPNQTLKEWKKDLQTAINLKPEHLSTYSLQIEEGTPLWNIISPHPHPLSQRERGVKNKYPKKTSRGEGLLQLPSEETDLAMYEHTIETLTSAGYKHYEISNFAKPGRECQHNLAYWRNKNYLGLGAGGHSHVNGKRWSNPNCVETYIQRPALRETQDDSHLATAQRETLFMGLRLLDGISKQHFSGFEKEVKELTQSGLLTTEKNNIKLTRKGLYLANEVFERFI